MRKTKAVYEFLPIYDRHLFFGNDLAEIKRVISHYFKDNECDLSLIDHDYAHGLVAPVLYPGESEKIQAFIMFVRDDVSLGTVAHEATHLTNQIFYYLGQELDAYNDEAQAYLTGYLTERFMAAVRNVKPEPRERKKFKNAK